jgi:hypothetical protein
MIVFLISFAILMLAAVSMISGLGVGASAGRRA